jgi:hypothetical protein
MLWTCFPEALKPNRGDSLGNQPPDHLWQFVYDWLQRSKASADSAIDYPIVILTPANFKRLRALEASLLRSLSAIRVGIGINMQ